MNSPIIGVDGAITIGDNYRKDLLGGATAGVCQTGDYMYQSANITWDIESGMWGNMHVVEEGEEGLIPLEQ